MIVAPCAIHMYATRVKRCHICAHVIGDIRERGDPRTPMAIAAAKSNARHRSRRTAKANRRARPVEPMARVRAA